MGRVVVEFVGKDSSLTAAQERTVKGAANITAEYKKISAETAKLDREAARIWEKTMTPLERYNAKMKDLGRLVDAGKISQEQFGRAAAMAKTDLDKQTSSLQTLVSSGTAKLAGMAASYIGVQQVISGINAELNDWLENQQKLGKETIDVTGGARAFAALQPVELMQPRVQEVLRVTGGRMPTTQAFDIVQGLQSASGSYEQAMKEFRDTILKAKDLGMKPELAQELVNMARPLGVDPALFVRQAYITGVAATRGTNEVAAAAVGLTSWTDKLLGMAAAGQITGLRGAEARPYLEQAGIGLSGVSPANEWFARQGLGTTATQEQRLQMLRSKRKDNMEKLQEIGFNEIRMMGGIVDLVNNLPNVEKYRAAIVSGTQAGFDVLARDVANVEVGLPSARAERMVEEARGRRMEFRFQPEQAARRAGDAAAIEALERAGIRSHFGLFGGGQFWDADEGVNWPRLWWARMNSWTPEKRAGILQAFEASSRATEEAMKDVQRNTRPRPAIPAPER